MWINIINNNKIIYFNFFVFGENAVSDEISLKVAMITLKINNVKVVLRSVSMNKLRNISCNMFGNKAKDEASLGDSKMLNTIFI